MYELIILAYLAQRATSGYQIMKVVNDAVGPYARISKGRLYPLLGRLETQGLIRPTADPGRATVYELTPSGHDRLIEILTDTESNPGGYQRLFGFKAMVIDLLTPAQRDRVLAHYRDYCQRHIEHLRAEAEELERAATDGGPPRLGQGIARVLRHQIRHWQLELDLVAALRPPHRTSASPGR